MSLEKIIKVFLLITVTLLATSCLEKANNLSTSSTDTTNKLWQWNDQQQTWLYNGTLFSPKNSDFASTAWDKQDNAILLRVESLKTLTAFDDAPKALQMKVFQLTDAVAFLRAAKSSSGLKHLLVTQHIDPAILGVERLFVLPGVSQSINLTRLEGARYIGIILGYSSLKQDKIFRLIPIVPVDGNQDASNVSGASTVLTSSFADNAARFSKTSTRPAVLKINLFLEAKGINKLDVDAR